MAEVRKTDSGHDKAEESETECSLKSVYKLY